jgi:hypothetical protein
MAASKKPLQLWRISVIGAKSKYIGRVMAADNETAIDKATEEFAIDPARRFRLVAEAIE